MKILKITAPLVALLLIAVACCCFLPKSESAGRIRVSPDGKWIAYLWEQSRTIPTGPEYATLRQHVSVCWASVQAPRKCRSARAAQWGYSDSKNRGSLLGQMHLVFSPRGTCLAVVCPEHLLFVELATGKSRKLALKSETVSSLCWLDEQTVAYVTYGASQQTAGGTAHVLAPTF